MYDGNTILDSLTMMLGGCSNPGVEMSDAYSGSELTANFPQYLAARAQSIFAAAAQLPDGRQMTPEQVLDKALTLVGKDIRPEPPSTPGLAS
jgi:hypothetical protein